MAAAMFSIVKDIVTDNPYTTTALVGSTAVALCPAVAVAPILGLVGFSSSGVVAGTMMGFTSQTYSDPLLAKITDKLPNSQAPLQLEPKLPSET